MASSTHSQSHMNTAIDKLMSNGVNNLQVKEEFIFPPHERPNMSEVCRSYSIPIIDIKDLNGPHRKRVVHEIRRACEVNGFFQIVNHDVPEILMRNMRRVAREFFELPVEDTAHLYSEDPKQSLRLFTSFNVTKDKVRNWRDCLRHPCYPLEEVIDSWPNKPAAYREVAGMYATEVRALTLRLLAAISESMGLEPDYVNRSCGKYNHLMTINYYPRCPNPDLTFAIPPHSDASVITVLMQGDVSGLQVLQDGKWVAVDPTPNAFVVNLGDQLEVFSNGQFKSIEHRAVTNSSIERMSFAMFYEPSSDAFIAPAETMVDEQHPPSYRGYKFEEYLNIFWGQGLKRKSVLDCFRIESDKSVKQLQAEITTTVDEIKQTCD